MKEIISSHPHRGIDASIIHECFADENSTEAFLEGCLFLAKVGINSGNDRFVIFSLGKAISLNTKRLISKHTLACVFSAVVNMMSEEQIKKHSRRLKFFLVSELVRLCFFPESYNSAKDTLVYLREVFSSFVYLSEESRLPLRAFDNRMIMNLPNILPNDRALILRNNFLPLKKLKGVEDILYHKYFKKN